MSDKQPLAWYSPQYYREAHALGSQRVSFIEHQGKRILAVDLCRTEADLFKAIAAEWLHVMSEQPAHSVLSLVEVDGSRFSTEVLKIGTELTDRLHPYTLRTALSGVAGFRSFALQTVANTARRPIRIFKDRTAALEWLVGEDSPK